MTVLEMFLAAIGPNAPKALEGPQPKPEPTVAPERSAAEQSADAYRKFLRNRRAGCSLPEFYLRGGTGQ